MNLNSKDHRLTKKGFKLWILGNCLTHIIEALQICLDNIINMLPEELNFEEIEKRYKKENKPPTCVENKLKMLEELLKKNHSREVPLIDITADEVAAIKSIRQVRNCIVHRHGKVDEKAAGKTNTLALKYIYLRKSKKPRKMIGARELYIKKFKLESIINITPQELYRIGIFLQMSLSNLLCNFRLFFEYPYDDNDIVSKSGGVIIFKKKL